jgi:hypothetical protein
MSWKLCWGQVVVWALACIFSSTAFADPTALDWETAFPVESAAKDVYLDAHFTGSDGIGHRLQLWRHGSEFLHRRTDALLDLYLRAAEKKGDYTYRLIDHHRRVAMDVGRNQLYRIGVFSDWFGLAHVLDRPKTEFVVRDVTPLPKDRLKDCSWRVLVRGGRQAQDQTRICWSSKWGLPMAIRVRGAKGEWIEHFGADRVEVISPSVGGLTLGMALPSVPDGYAAFDAGREIDPKQGD